MPKLEIPEGFEEVPEQNGISIEIPEGFEEVREEESPSESGFSLNSAVDIASKGFLPGLIPSKEQIRRVGDLPGKIEEEKALTTIGGIAGGVSAGAPGAALGAGSGSLVEQNISNIGKLARGEETKGTKDVLLEAGKDAAINGLFAAVTPIAVKGAVRGVKAGTKFVAKNIAGLSDEAIQTILNKPKEVAAQIKKVSREKVAEIGKSIGDSIEENVDFAQDLYKRMIDQATKDTGFIRINFSSKMSPALSKVQEKFGFGIKGRVKGLEDNEIFKAFTDRLKELSSATPQEVYFYQRDLNGAARKAFGTELGAALHELQKQARAILSKTHGLPMIKEANKVLSGALSLEREGRRVINSDSPVDLILSAMRRATRTRDAINNVAKALPRVGGQLKDLEVSQAALESQPLIRKIPQTGFAALPFLGAGAGLAGGVPGAIAAGGATALAGSPRFMSLLLRGLSKSGANLSDPQTIESLRVLSQLLSQQIRKER